MVSGLDCGLRSCLLGWFVDSSGFVLMFELFNCINSVDACDSLIVLVYCLVVCGLLHVGLVWGSVGLLAFWV